MEKVSVKGLEVSYEKEGEGIPLLVLHGWGASSESWKEVRENLNGYEVIIPDLPGFGESETPTQSWTVEDYIEFIEEFTQKLNLPQFYLLGHSFGGSLAVKFTAAHPEKVRKMILMDSAGIKPEPKLIAKVLKSIAQKGEAVFAGPLAKFKNTGKKVFYKLIERTDYGKVDEVMKETMKNVFDYYTKHDLQSGNFLTDLKKVNVETLLVWGKEDEIIPLKYGKIFKEKIDDSSLKTLSDVRHSPHLKKPAETAQIISNFFK